MCVGVYMCALGLYNAIHHDGVGVGAFRDIAVCFGPVHWSSYCIIVFNLPQRNRSSIDYTNYCMDFGKRVVQHPQFHSIKCPKKAKK